MKKTANTLLSQLLPVCFMLLFFSCQGQPKQEASSTTRTDSSRPRPNPPAPKGKGSLSFKLDGQLYTTDPKRTKCWTVVNIPGAMLMARGEGVQVSWQMGYTEGQKEYKLDGDKKGTINFTIGGKTYWTKSVLGDNFLNITITHIKDKYSLKLLSGTFEGVLEDKAGNKVQITEGRFTTDDM